MLKERFIPFLLALILLIMSSKSKPIGFTQVQKITSWWPQSNIAKSIGVPGYANTEYNYFSFGTWSCSTGLGSMSTVFARPLSTFGNNFLGTTDDAIRNELKKKYQTTGARVILSAFGDSDYPMRFGKSPTECATKLANDAQSYDFDGVQIVFQDDYSISQGKAEQWLIDFTKKLRQLLPNQKIIHTVQAKYFQSTISPNGGYIKINKEVGNIIDFYNIKYYGNVENAYDTYNELFVKSSSPNTGTAVKEINGAGVPMSKIVIGKSAKSGVNGYVDPAMLGNWAVSAKNQVGWSTGFWLGSFDDDQQGAGIKNAIKLLEFSEDDNKTTPYPTPQPTPQPTPKPTPKPIPDNKTDDKNNSVVPATGYKLPYPIYLAYVNGVSTWWGDDFLAGMGVPGYATQNPYNYFVLAFWLTSGPVDMAIVWAQASKYFSWLGTDTQQIQIKLKKAYNDAGKKILVSAFGATQFPTTQGKEAVKTANDLADFVLANNLDGVDIDWQDNGAMEAGTGEQWLIKFQTTLRARLPNHIIIHAPQAPYFKQQHYKNGAYITVDKKVGQTIDYYAVQFYNQGDTRYDTYEGLFKKAGGWFSGTSVQEIIDRGVPARKVVVGKPATMADVMNSGYTSPQNLGQFLKQWKQQTGNDPQLMFWQYLNDKDGSICRTALQIAGVDWKNYRFVDPSSMMTGIDDVSEKDKNKTLPKQTSYKVPYPIYFAYANGLASWWGDGMLSGLGVPGYTPELPYNYMALSFWMTSGSADLAYIWENAGTAMSFVGGDTQSIQKKIKRLYNQKGIKLLVSAFGATEFPTSAGKDPIATANSLATFVLNNNLDGVDIDWQDNSAMEAGTGQQWLISFQTQLRSQLPNHIITHAPQAPYFKQEYYKNGGYKTVNDRVGNTIDFYTVQFYNQGNTRYDSYDELFIKSTGVFSGTAVKELIDRGVSAKKIVVGKPATMADVMNTGYVAPGDLGTWLGRFKQEYNWKPSVMFWQFKNDARGDIIKQVLSAAGVNYRDQGFIDGSNDTSPPSPAPQPQPQPKPKPEPKTKPEPKPTPTPKPDPKPEPTPSDNSVNPAPGASHVLSMFYCGFSGNFCGQSTTDDVNPKSSIVILAFANTNSDGTITVDTANYPTSVVQKWKAAGKKVILSVGGQNGHWDVVFKSDGSIDNFINSINGYLTQFNLDGIDLDIEDYRTTPRIVADTIIRLKKKIGSKLLIVSPQNVAVYQATSVPSADVGGQAFNYFVPIINLADAYIDFYQPQVYNNWFGGYPGGSFAYMKETYLHWRNLQGTMEWSGPIPDFKGVSGNKLIMGILASTSAGGSQYYAQPNVIVEFKAWIKQNNYPLKGFMMWDSNWDTLNNMVISNAATDLNF